MAFGALYSNGAMVIHAVADSAAVAVGNITNLSMPPNIATVVPQSGSLYDYHRSIAAEAPVANITTESIAQILDACGALAKCITADGTHPGLELYGEKHDECNARATGASHNQYTISQGLLVPTTLEATVWQNATISLEAHATYGGSDDPLVPAYGVALPSSVVSDEIYCVGKCKVAGQLLENVQSVSINFGISVLKKGGAGQPAPQWASAAKIQPTVTITTTDPTVVDAAKLSLEGTEATHSDSFVYLQKRASYGKFANVASMVHIKITMAGLVVVEQPHSASGESEASVSFRVEGVHDGTDVPIVIDTTSAYAPT